MKKSGLIACMATFVLLTFPEVARSKVPPGTTRYVPQNPQANTRNVKKGLAIALKQVNPFLRPFVRAQLDPKTFDVKVLEFVRDKSGFVIRHDGHSTYSPSSGVHALLVRGEEKLRLTQHLTSSGASQRFETKQGVLSLRYEFDVRTNIVHVHAQLSSGYLPSPVLYHLTFRKTSSRP